MGRTGPNTARMWSIPARTRCAFRSIRSGRACDRRGRHRLLRAARGLARRGRASRPADRRLDLRSRLSRRNLAAARASIGITRTTRRALRRTARRSPTDRQAVDIPRQGHQVVVATAHYERVGGSELPSPTGVDAAKQADLADGGRLSARWTKAPTSRTCFPTPSRRKTACRISPAAAATI